MPTERIILVDGSRLLREMLQRVINKTEGLQVIDELNTLGDVRGLLGKSDYFDWIIVPLSETDTVPVEIEEIIARHPKIKVIAVSADGARIRLKWIETHEKTLNGLSLDDLISILKERKES